MNLPRKLALRAGFGALTTEAVYTPTSGHQARIVTGPTPMEVDAWRTFHRVIWHRKAGSPPQTLNVEHHNFYNAYACNVGTEDIAPIESLPFWTQAARLGLTKALNPFEGVGLVDCLHD